jgi:sugar diacid utilization regulator
MGSRVLAPIPESLDWQASPDSGLPSRFSPVAARSESIEKRETRYRLQLKEKVIRSMPTARLYLQPSVRQLLSADALSEAQVLTGQDKLDQQVQQVVFGFGSARAGSLVVARAESLGSQDTASIKELSAVIAIQPMAQPAAALAAVASSGAAARPSAGAGIDLDLERLTATFTQLNVPLIMLPGLAEPPMVAEEIRNAFQSEIKRNASRLHAHFVSCVLESGLQELVDELAELVSRPVAVETADFKILASQNMSPTPASQQKTLTEEVAEELRLEMRANSSGMLTGLPEQPVRIGRRLVMPILLEGVVVGYFSMMLRPNDDHQFLSEYLAPASLAALVDFSHRRKEVSTFTVTQKSLLKDLLSGVSLSAGDQERLEQHFGFDLCDGFIVIVVQVSPREAARDAVWPQDIAMVEIESNRVFVFPHDSNAAKTWQQHAEGLIAIVKEKRSDLKVQLGASRIAASLLDLPDAYREARQALIIGSMVSADKEFSVGYGELGIKRLLYLMIDHPELDRFYEENLALLEAYDAEWETDLVPTLRVYLEQGANLNSAAKALFIHRHTMRYRLEQIAEILNVDIDSSEVLLNLQIAFLIRDMKGKRSS